MYAVLLIHLRTRRVLMPLLISHLSMNTVYKFHCLSILHTYTQCDHIHTKLQPQNVHFFHTNKLVLVPILMLACVYYFANTQIVVSTPHWKVIFGIILLSSLETFILENWSTSIYYLELKWRSEEKRNK